MGRPGRRAALVAAAMLVGLAGCGSSPQALPTIGSPTPTPVPSQTQQGRSTQLARQWDLSGAPLPADWPDVPLPRGTEVTTAYAIGAAPRRTWTATFAADSGSALALAEPVVAELRKRDYVPIAEYVGPEESNTGLYSFAAPTFAVYVVLGEDAGRPNVVITVRGSTADDASSPTPPEPSAPGQPGPAVPTGGSSTALPSPTVSPSAPPSASGPIGGMSAPPAAAVPPPGMGRDL